MSDTLDVGNLKIIPLVFAGWMRYLMGIDDNGEAFELSPDPLLDTVRPCVASLRLVKEQDVRSAVEPLLGMKQIFGVDLRETPLADMVCGYLKELTDGKGAVRRTLKKYIHP